MINTETRKPIDWTDQAHKSALQTFLKDLRRDVKEAGPFLDPVPWEAMGLLDYP